ncbi:hypothetical protein F5Y07DRAFT_51915 [Xylaria sp. FL0933]|nr:hypothetical protein F5Y07DRAFT_51915 [Xylaria sp. FL0933]
MGHQEASPPPQRHRVPHHRRHHHHSHHHAAAQPTDRSQPLSLGRLNRESHAPDSHAAVERWLGQLAAPVPAKRLVSPPSRNQPLHRGKRLRPQDSYGNSPRQRPGRVDRLWRSQHIPLGQGSSPPHPPLLTNLDKNSKRHKRNSDDSSLVSELSLRREPQKWDCNETAPGHGKSPHCSPLDETKVRALDASSPVSHIGTREPTFEKRPRHKTRPDKYDTKKSHVREGRANVTDQGKHQSRGSKSKKRKHAVNGKNVMKNFTSDAVTSGRITVQPNLKPGLFNNKRAPKEHPVSDLCFSEMPFPTPQERDVPQQKGLSSSRARELQRENRELEHISSFFLPPCADPTTRDSKPIRTGTTKRTCKNNATPSSSTEVSRSYRQQSFMSIENSSIPVTTTSGPEYRPSSSKTTYFTWSSSQHSPNCRSYLVDTPLQTMESTRSSTPEGAREALATTRVYVNTGDRSYNNSNGPRKHVLQATGESSSTCSSIVDRRDAHNRRESTIHHGVNTKSRCADDTRAIMARLARLEDRWNTILPPEWKLQRPPEDEISPVSKQPDDTAAVKKPEIAELPSRQEIAEQSRVKPVRQHSRAHQTCHDEDPDSTPNVHHTPKSAEIMGDSAPADEDQITITSRDAMPPPPVPPPRVTSLRSTDPKSECDIVDSSILIETAGSQEPHLQVSNLEHAEFINPYETVGERYKTIQQSEQVIPTPSSVSWIPQAVTPGAASCDRHDSCSRLSMRSSIYENQGKEMNPNATLRFTSSPLAHTSETMADFIARIESELNDPTYSNEHCQPDSTIEDQSFSIDSTTGTYDAQNQYLPVTDGPQADYRHPQTSPDDVRFKNAIASNRGIHGHELAVCARDNSTTICADGQKNDDIDESLEMSKFWGPNRFSWL